MEAEPVGPELSSSFDRTSVIDGLYRMMLGRPPDEGGLAYHLESLATVDDADFVKTITMRLLGSEEFRQTWTVRMHRSERIASDPALQVRSIGTHCLASEMLEDMGLRGPSLPFDWIYSTPEMIVHAIDDDFEQYLDRALYRFVPVEERPVPTLNIAHHDFYRAEFGVEHLFNHHDPVHNDADYDHFCRAVRRFKQPAEPGTRRLYVMINHDRRPSDGHGQAFRELGARLDGFGLFINLVQGQGLVPTYEIDDASPHHESARFITRGVVDGVQFSDEMDRLLLSDTVSRRLEAAAYGTSELGHSAWSSASTIRPTSS